MMSRTLCVDAAVCSRSMEVTHVEHLKGSLDNFQLADGVARNCV